VNRDARNRAPFLALCALVLVAVTGCSTVGNPTGTNPGGRMMGRSGVPTSSAGSGGSGGGMMGRNGSGATSYSSDGQRIYLTGVGVDGRDIPRTAPPVSQGSLMMGGGGCGSCHAADGHGGTIRMMSGTAIKAPDITYGALIKTGFTDATIRDAIRKGLDEAGKPLKDAMPRWQMSDADLSATIAYLKVLGPK
jgi:hypothetical protein